VSVLGVSLAACLGDVMMGLVEEVVTVSSAERLPEWSTSDHVPVDELARRQGVAPLSSADDLIEPGLFESDQELEEFLADLYASRRAGMA